MKSKYTSTFGINFAIVIYYFLPRVQITTNSPNWNMFFNLRNIVVLLLTIGMLVITFQKTYSDKHHKIDLGRMVTGAYILYGLASIFYLMVPEFF